MCEEQSCLIALLCTEQSCLIALHGTILSDCSAHERSQESKSLTVGLEVCFRVGCIRLNCIVDLVGSVIRARDYITALARC